MDEDLKDLNEQLTAEINNYNLNLEAKENQITILVEQIEFLKTQTSNFIFKKNLSSKKQQSFEREISVTLQKQELSFQSTTAQCGPGKIGFNCRRLPTELERY